MMKWPEFAERIRSTGEYHTPDNMSLSLVDRLLGRFDWWYHTLITHKVSSSAVCALREKLDNSALAQKNLEVIQIVERCGGRVKIEIPPATLACWPCVYVANHMSVLEALILPGILLCFGHPTFVIRKDLLDYPVMKYTLQALDPICVTRTNPREDLKTVLLKGTECIKNGKAVQLYPQAYRNPVFDPSVFTSMGVKLADRAGVPIVPIALKTDFSGLGPIIKEYGRVDRSKTVHFRFGNPMNSSDGRKDVHRKTIDFITASLREWGGQIKSQDQGSA